MEDNECAWRFLPKGKSHPYSVMDSSGNLPSPESEIVLFRPGINLTSRAYRRVHRPRNSRLPITPALHRYTPWRERIKTVSASGLIRLLDPPPTGIINFAIDSLWNEDISLTEWLKRLEAERNPTPIMAAFRVMGQLEHIENIFYGNQRKRWLARVVLRNWTQRVWRKRTQCNVDMIDMQPIADKDAVFLTDTKHRMIFRFHRSDIFKNLLTNICMADELLPSPRPPTNPWTNSVLTMSQTMGICQQLVADYAKRGICPPVLFSAFWAARFSIKRFLSENSALLAQHAVRSYFKDLHEHNMSVVFDTISSLLTNAGLDFSPTAIRRWLNQRPQTALHREWLEMARDYTLYINLHVQVRPGWHNDTYISMDVERLYARTVPSTRIITRRVPNYPRPEIIIPQPSAVGLLGLPLMIVDISANDISGSDLSYAAAIDLIRSALFHD